MVTRNAHGDPLADALTLNEAIADLLTGNPWAPGTGAHARRNIRLAQLRRITADDFGIPDEPDYSERYR